MNVSYNCASVKEFNDMVRRVRHQLFTDIECIYNIGSSQYYEYPLFICTHNHVFRLYYSESNLSLTVYTRDFFREHNNSDIFRDSEHPHDFDYIFPEAYCPDSRICDMLSIKGCGTKHNLKGFDVVFSNGKLLCIRESDFVPYTMDSWIVE